MKSESSGGVVVQGSIPSLAATISEIGYLLLLSRDMAPIVWASRVTYMTWTLMWERQYCYLQLVERRKHNYAALVMHLKAFNKGNLRRYNCKVTTPRKVCGLIINATFNNIHQIKVAGYRPESNFYLGTHVTDRKGYLPYRTYQAICRCH